MFLQNVFAHLPERSSDQSHTNMASGIFSVVIFLKFGYPLNNEKYIYVCIRATGIIKGKSGISGYIITATPGGRASRGIA